MREGYGPLEADFQRFYGIDLNGLFEGEFGLMRAANLAVNLPPESATWRKLNPDWEWDLPAQLLAATVDQLAEVAYLLKAAHFKGTHQPPKPLPRPGVTPAEDASRIGAGEGFETIAEFDAWLAEKRKPKSE